MIDRNWIVTSATCCKRDEIVTVKFNDYSIFFPDDQEHQIISTLFQIHQDLDVCLIRTAADISEIIDKIPCLTKVCASLNLPLPIINPYWQILENSSKIFSKISAFQVISQTVLLEKSSKFFSKIQVYDPKLLGHKVILENSSIQIS